MLNVREACDFWTLKKFSARKITSKILRVGIPDYLMRSMAKEDEMVPETSQLLK